MSWAETTLGVAFLVYVFVVLPVATAYVGARFTVPTYFPALARRPQLTTAAAVLLGGTVPVVFAVALRIGCRID
ncbi:hypothetical protein [Haladaptatus salinisoli]|uniref:hypothetical protein n=1 Tax=Haladaptatus salinisoli TaxID=2884876 RepID=UPI001D0B2A25|nr:hypothetical protein [Haladaptatus salinisoli]